MKHLVFALLAISLAACHHDPPATDQTDAPALQQVLPASDVTPTIGLKVAHGDAVVCQWTLQQHVADLVDATPRVRQRPTWQRAPISIKPHARYTDTVWQDVRSGRFTNADC